MADLRCHKIKSGDSVWTLLSQEYGEAYVARNFEALSQKVRVYNPNLTDLSRIQPGKCLFLPAGPTGQAPVCSPINPSGQPSADQLRRYLDQTGEAEDGIYQLISPGDAAEHAMTVAQIYAGGAVKDANIALAGRLERSFKQYKAGKITSYQHYQVNRPYILQEMSRLNDPYQKRAAQAILDAGKQPYRISPQSGRIQGSAKGMAPAGTLKWLGRGNAALTVGLGAHEIYSAETTEDRSETIVMVTSQTIGGAAGTKVGLAGGALLVATVTVTGPVAVGIVIVFGVAGALGGSYGGGEAAKLFNDAAFYDQHGNRQTSQFDKIVDNGEDFVQQAAQTAERTAGAMWAGAVEIANDVGDGAAKAGKAFGDIWDEKTDALGDKWDEWTGWGD